VGVNLKNVGVLGFGVSGRSILEFLTSKKQDVCNRLFQGQQVCKDAVSILIWDEKIIDGDLKIKLKNRNVLFVGPNQFGLQQFVDYCDFVVASPGICLNDYLMDDPKLLCELDLFSLFFKKPVVGITGTLGKTSVTKLIGSILRVTNKLFEGGNIGIGLLDVFKQQASFDLSVLELSSFQLERSKYFAPDVAVLTNFYANHLDRHKSLKSYFEAKFSLFKYQSVDQIAIIDAAWIFDEKLNAKFFIEKVQSLLCFVCMDGSIEKLSRIVTDKAFSVVHLDDGFLCVSEFKGGSWKGPKRLLNTSLLPAVTFIENWGSVLAVLFGLRFDFNHLKELLLQNELLVLNKLDYRLEAFTSFKGIDFYDDSKATVLQATYMAVKRLSAFKRPIILILGGVGKGVDRSRVCSILSRYNQIKQIYCFGRECCLMGFDKDYESIDEVVDQIFSVAVTGDIVLFSPSGASFDLFQNYQQRGKAFKELVFKKIDSL
jgi:UDP-N-acetylmuramoylalanine--D-glutamate ligase